MNEIPCNIIEIKWEGPYSIEAMKAFTGNIGLYQIYGAHPIYGSNSLLYIGMTIAGFESRFSSHYNDWIKYEYDDVKIYVGEVVTLLDNDTTESVKIAEKLLLYYCAPGYNSNDLVDFKLNVDRNIILLNYGRIARLPTEVSTIWYNSAIWKTFEGR
jgi:hypothetical protein